MIALVINTISMFLAVYWPKLFGDGFWSRLVFTINFLTVIVNFGILVKQGVIG